MSSKQTREERVQQILSSAKVPFDPGVWYKEMANVDQSEEQMAYELWPAKVSHGDTTHWSPTWEKTPTGRWSASNPAVLGVKKNLRLAVQEAGRYIVSADIKSSHPRILAAHSHDTALQADVESGKLYEKLALAWNCEREQAKVGTMLLLNSAGSDRFTEIGLDRKAIRNIWKGLYPKANAFLYDLRKEAEKNGEIQLPYDLGKLAIPSDRGSYLATSYYLLSIEAYYMELFLLRIQKECPELQILMTQYDAAIFSVDSVVWRDKRQKLVDALSFAYHDATGYSNALKIEWGSSWGGVSVIPDANTQAPAKVPTTMRTSLQLSNNWRHLGVLVGMFGSKPDDAVVQARWDGLVRQAKATAKVQYALGKADAEREKSAQMQPFIINLPLADDLHLARYVIQQIRDRGGNVLSRNDVCYYAMGTVLHHPEDNDNRFSHHAITTSLEGKYLPSGLPVILGQRKIDDIRSLIASECARDTQMRIYGAPFANGLLQPDGSFLPWKIEDRMCADEAMAVEYHPIDWRGTVWEQYLDSLFAGDEDAAQKKLYLAEYIGACMHGEATTYEAMTLLKGSGSNGKSVFLDAIAAAFKGQVSSVPLETLLDRLDLHVGAISANRFNLVHELSRKELVNSAGLKSIVSGNETTLNEKFKSPVKVKPIAGWVCNVNELPAMVETTHGDWRRLVVIKFNHTFTQNSSNVNLRHVLTHNPNWVHNWAQEGYMRLLAQGNYTNVPSSDSEKLSWRESSNNVQSFINAYGITADPNLSYQGSLDVEDVYAAYVSHAEKTGSGKKSQANFLADMRNILNTPNLEVRGGPTKNHKKLRVRMLVATMHSYGETSLPDDMMN